MTEVMGKVKVKPQALVSHIFSERSRGQSTDHRHPKLLASRALYVARLVTWLGIVLRRVQREHRLDQGGGGGVEVGKGPWTGFAVKELPGSVQMKTEDGELLTLNCR